MDKLIQWQARPVFITSTFRDMHAERDYLNSHVFPELQERLRERFTHLEPIDLRIGVETVSTDEQHAKELLVLKVCLAEVKRSRPFLIALLGDRYGWVPPEERMIAAAQEAGFDQPVAGRSVTDLEIDYGVLDKPEQVQRSFFYFRAPLPYDNMPPAIAAEYSEQHNPDPQAKAAAEQLSSLKQRIVDRVPDRVRHYTAQWDSDRQCVTGLEDWGKQVLEDLWSDLKTETAAHAQQGEISWQQAERLNLEQFIEDRSLDFTGRESTLNELEQFAIAPDKPAADSLPGMATNTDWGRCLTGPAGAGKSAVFAQLYRRFQTGNQLMLAHAAGTSPRSSSIDDMLRAWINELATKLNIENPLPDDAKPEDIEQQFRMLLGRAGNTQRVVILVDALNQFEATNRARYLSWLPPIWPANVRFIATAIPGAETNALKQREGIEALALEAMKREEAEQIVKTIYSRYHREVNREVQAELLNKKQATGKPAYGNPLWLHLATEHLNQLDADDFARAEQDFAGTPEQRQHQLILRLIEEMPTDVPALYSWMLNRAEKTFGENWTRAFVNLIAVSRAGWRESDLKVMMPIVSGQTWDDLQFAVLRRYFKNHISQRGANNQWDFNHAQLRQAVEKRNLADIQLTQRLHGQIGDYLFELRKDDPLHETETMVHLHRADDKDGAAHYYGSELTNSELKGATALLAELILLDEEKTGAQNDATKKPGIAWAEKLLHADRSGQSQRGIICERYIFDLYQALESHALLNTRFELMRPTATTLQTLTVADPGNARWQRDLSVSHEIIGDIRRAQGDLGGALTAFQRCLAIRQQLANLDPGNAEWQRDLALILSRIGYLAQAQGDLGGALTAFEMSLTISQQLANQEPGNAEWQRDLAGSNERIGNIRQAQGDLAGALTAFEMSLTISQQLANQEPGNAEWQRTLAVSHERIGNIRQAQGDLAGALAAFERSLAISQQLDAQDPGNAEWQRDLAVSHTKLGEIQLAQENPGGALAAFGMSLTISQQLADQDPGNAEWQRDLAVYHTKLGEIRQAQEDLGGALSAFEMSLTIHQQLADQDPGNAEWQRDLAVSHTKVGYIRQAQGDLAGALSTFEMSLTISQQLADQELGNTQCQLGLWVSHESIGGIRRTLGDICGALAAFEAGCDVASHMVDQDPENTLWKQYLWASHAQLDDILCAHEELGDAFTTSSKLAITKRGADNELHDIQQQRALYVSHIEVGENRQGQGDLGGALTAFEMSLAIAKQLADQDPGNAQWQWDLSVSHEIIGDIRQAQGDLDGALAAFERSLAIRQQLADQDPGNAQWQRNLAVSHERIGNIRQGQGDLDGALAAFERSLAIRQQLADQDPGNAQWQWDLSVSHDQIGNIRQAQGDLDGALTAFEQGVAICQQQADQNPSDNEWQRALSFSNDRIGAILQSQGDLDGALVAAKQNMEMSKKLIHKNPDNAEWKRAWSANHINIGGIRQAQGDLDGALTTFEEGLAIAQQLAEQDPGNAELQQLLSVSLERVGIVQQAQENLDNALVSFEASLAITSRLANKDPLNTDWQHYFPFCSERIGDIQRAQENHDGALIAYENSLEVLQLTSDQHHDDAQVQHAISRTYEKIGDIKQTQGDLRGALAAIELNLGINTKLADQYPGNADLQENLARSFYTMADLMNRENKQDEAIHYRRNCYSTLQNMKSAGMDIGTIMADIHEQLKQEFNP